MSRVIDGLVWAKECPRPKNIPVGRPRGSKAAGLRYERLLAKALPTAKHGQWIEFQDKFGHGYCQPDLVLVQDEFVLVLEAKYTWVAEGHSQIEYLYRPVLEKIWRKPVRGVVVCKVLVRGMPGAVRVTGTLGDAIDAARSAPCVLHWPGMAPGPLALRAAPAHIDLDASGL